MLTDTDEGCSSQGRAAPLSIPEMSLKASYNDLPKARRVEETDFSAEN